jgi:hypothetical protein
VAQLRPGDAVSFTTIEADAARILAQAEWAIEELG